MVLPDVGDQLFPKTLVDSQSFPSELGVQLSIVGVGLGHQGTLLYFVGHLRAPLLAVVLQLMLSDDEVGQVFERLVFEETAKGGLVAAIDAVVLL